MFVLLLLSGCSHKEGHKPTNLPPRVKVSGGPPQGSSANYSVPLFWFGWDDDGVVDHFLYKIDDDTVWTETDLFQGSFLFMADTLRPDSEFGRWHTFWIKAIDNEGAESSPDFLTFDARTIAPKTTIQSPSCDLTTGLLCEGPRGVGLSVKIVWKGEDVDSRDPRKLPVAYQWRLLNLNKLGFSNGCVNEQTCATLLDTTQTPCEPGDTCWTQPTTETQHRFNGLQSGTFWLFGVRAIDEASAVEPGLYLWRNVTYFKTMEGLGRPTLTVCEGSVCHEFPSEGEVWEREAPMGKQLNFSWYGDASLYGGTITGYTYGVDIEDLNDQSQWEGWSADVKTAQVVFTTPGLHYFYVRVRDYADEETIGIVELTVIKFEFDRDLLLIDDYFDVTPNDLAHDTFVEQMLRRFSAYTDTMYIFNYYHATPLTREMQMFRSEPTLGELSRYKVVIWDVYGPTNGYDVALNRMNIAGNLDVYFKAGGRAWFYGFSALRATDPTNTWQYPINLADLSNPQIVNSFAYRFMKISGYVNKASYDPAHRGDGFKGGIPFRAVSDALPVLNVDSLAQGVGPYGLWGIEAVTSPMQEPDFDQRPDTLYFYRSNYATSSYKNAACGFRFHDLYSGSKLAYVGFPMHYFKHENADSLGNFMIDWLFEGLTLQPSGIALR